ncbi:MAG: sulfate ABC transporter substrate-binding protein [Verrucomicrobiales bacterium]|nr:sulfate ABC transporter substrate-binding protein [Verrucomicrobiales bacterium]
MLGLLLGLVGVVAPLKGQARKTELLNVSFDISRELFGELNAAFVADWKTRTGETVIVRQSHAGSSKQARAVIDGLEADVVTLNQATDLDVMASGGAVATDWRSQFAGGASPYTSAVVFLVRPGNPKRIRDWSDLIRTNVTVVLPNPKTSGNGRYSFLAAYAYARHRLNYDEARTLEFLKSLLRNVPVLDTGGRAATTTFAQRGIGDVLLTFEAEARLTARELGTKGFEVVLPEYNIEAEMPVAVVDRVVRKKGTETVARAYLNFLYTEAAQEIIARHGFRPRSEAVLARHAADFGGAKFFRVEPTLGPWGEVQKRHFAEGGTFDQIFQNLR